MKTGELKDALQSELNDRHRRYLEWQESQKKQESQMVDEMIKIQSTINILKKSDKSISPYKSGLPENSEVYGKSTIPWAGIFEVDVMSRLYPNWREKLEETKTRRSQKAVDQIMWIETQPTPSDDKFHEIFNGLAEMLGSLNIRKSEVE